MSKIIAFANQKGGVTKTTTTSAFATGITKKGFKVLAIDTDPQGNLSDSIGAQMYEVPTIYELLMRHDTVENAIQHLEAFDIIPANIMLAGAEQELLSQMGKEHRLSEAIEPIKNKYDYVVIDTPPSLGVLTLNAFTLADEIIIPTTPGIFSAKGIHQLYNTILNTRKYLNSKLLIRGVVLTKYNPRAIINQNVKELTEALAKDMEAPVFKAYIRNSVIIEEAQANQQDLFSYKTNSTVAEDYEAFVNEYLEGEQ